MVLVRLPLIFTWAVFDSPPEKPPPVGVAHVYVVPAGTLPFVTSVGVSVKGVPPQVTVLIVEILPAGFIVTVTEKSVPVQPAETGVTM